MAWMVVVGNWLADGVRTSFMRSYRWENLWKETEPRTPTRYVRSGVQYSCSSSLKRRQRLRSKAAEFTDVAINLRVTTTTPARFSPVPLPPPPFSGAGNGLTAVICHISHDSAATGEQKLREGNEAVSIFFSLSA